MATNEQRREAAKRKLANQQQRRVDRSKQRQRTAVITAVSVVVLVVVAVVLLTTLGGGSGGSSDTAAPPSTPAAPSDTDTPASDTPPPPAQPIQIPTAIAPRLTRPNALPASVSCAYPADEGGAAKPVGPPPTTSISARGTAPATLTTTAGRIGLTLDRALAPCTVNSFLSLARQKYFDNTPCHRLTTQAPLQVLQCGDPTGSGSGGPGYAYADEVYPQLTYGRGYLAMANSGPNTNGSQFFMIYGDASGLPPSYTVFGYIDPPGLQVLDTVARAGDDGSLDPSPGGGAPNTKVMITGVTTG